MTRSKSVALTFYLGAALAGAAIGVSVDRVVARSAWNPLDRFAARKRLWDDLHLTPSQRDSADHIFDERNRADSVLRAPVRPATDSVNARAHSAPDAVCSRPNKKPFTTRCSATTRRARRRNEVLVHPRCPRARSRAGDRYWRSRAPTTRVQFRWTTRSASRVQYSPTDGRRPQRGARRRGGGQVRQGAVSARASR